MLSIRALILQPTLPTGNSDAGAIRSDHTPLEGGVDGASAEGPYASLNDHLHPPQENVYGMASASSRMDLALALGGKRRPLPRTPSPAREAVGPGSPRSRTPTSDYEQVDLPGDTRCVGQPPAGHPLPPRPAASPDHEAIYSTPESPGPVFDTSPPLWPSQPGVYFELEPEGKTDELEPERKTDEPPAKPPRTGAYRGPEAPDQPRTPTPPLPARPPTSGVHGALKSPGRPKTPPPPPPQHAKPGRTPGAAESPVAVGDEKKTRFQSVNSELAAFLAKRRIE